jgi:hypothetical protein
MKYLLFIFLFTYFSYAQEDNLLGNLSLIDETSEELNIIIGHLNFSKVTPTQAQEVVAACQLINNDTTHMDRINLLFLIKSEIYKGLLNNQYLAYEDTVQISEVIVKSIEEKFKKYELSYGAFAKWIFKSIQNDLAPYRKDSFLNRYQTVSRTNMKEMALALSLKKSLKYISPWLIAIESQTPEQFNNTLTQIAIDILKQISRKTYFFKEFSTKFASKQRDEIFNIPNLNIKPEPSVEAPDGSLQKIKEIKAEEAKKTLEVLENTKESSGQKEAIDQLLNDKNSSDSQWTPKE